MILKMALICGKKTKPMIDKVGESALLPIMVKAVQELSAKVEELESKLNGE